MPALPSLNIVKISGKAVLKMNSEKLKHALSFPSPHFQNLHWSMGTPEIAVPEILVGGLSGCTLTFILVSKTSFFMKEFPFL